MSMSVKELKKKIDKYGKMSTELDDLKKEIGINMEDVDEERVSGKFYEALQYSSSVFKDADPRQVYEILDNNFDLFMDVVKVIKKELKKKIGDEKVDELSPETGSTTKMKIAPVKKK